MEEIVKRECIECKIKYPEESFYFIHKGLYRKNICGKCQVKRQNEIN